MKNRTATSTKPNTLKASRRASPTERARVARLRRRQIRRAVLESDYEISQACESQIVSSCISRWAQKLDEMARPNTHPNYRGMSSLKATHHFAEIYASVMSDAEWVWGGSFVEHNGLESMSVANIDLMWRARATADLLGMDYERYIAAISISWVARGHDEPTPLRALIGPQAVAVATYARQLWLVADENQDF